ncbi:hypothetical protein GCM10023168_22210 [Fodinibacter luteus]|uniref:Uncharacterized protein n=1 Tax=Fodinibacter luteus TaxID=552064 RepID=A0ABP8KGW8_9MICO
MFSVITPAPVAASGSNKMGARKIPPVAPSVSVSSHSSASGMSMTTLATTPSYRATFSGPIIRSAARSFSMYSSLAADSPSPAWLSADSRNVRSCLSVKGRLTTPASRTLSS